MQEAQTVEAPSASHTGVAMVAVCQGSAPYRPPKRRPLSQLSQLEANIFAARFRQGILRLSQPCAAPARVSGDMFAPFALQRLETWTSESQGCCLAKDTPACGTSRLCQSDASSRRCLTVTPRPGIALTMMHDSADVEKTTFKSAHETHSMWPF
eukprot:6263934-Prymnesium_polylepis.1